MNIILFSTPSELIPLARRDVGSHLLVRIHIARLAVYDIAEPSTQYFLSCKNHLISRYLLFSQVNLAYENVKEVDCLDISREGCDAWEAAVRRYEDRIGMNA